MTTLNYYQPPSHFRVAVINPILRLLVLRFGLGGQGEQDVMRILRVRGRKSGKLYDVPVRVAVMDGRRYVLSMLGEAQWVRNLRAAGEAEMVVGEQVEAVRCSEVHGEEKAAFLRWYCQHPDYKLRARFALRVDVNHLTEAEIKRVAGLYPVFGLERMTNNLVDT
jgi:deazaflavin-dependent oxidoreductase (nitroreductase family)